MHQKKNTNNAKLTKEQSQMVQVDHGLEHADYVIHMLEQSYHKQTMLGKFDSVESINPFPVNNEYEVVARVLATTKEDGGATKIIKQILCIPEEWMKEMFLPSMLEQLQNLQSQDGAIPVSIHGALTAHQKKILDDMVEKHHKQCLYFKQDAQDSLSVIVAIHLHCQLTKPEEGDPEIEVENGEPQ